MQLVQLFVNTGHFSPHSMHSDQWTTVRLELFIFPCVRARKRLTPWRVYRWAMCNWPFPTSRRDLQNGRIRLTACFWKPDRCAKAAMCHEVQKL
jgi:hypothetical protein